MVQIVPTNCFVIPAFFLSRFSIAVRLIWFQPLAFWFQRLKVPVISKDPTLPGPNVNGIRPIRFQRRLNILSGGV
jgi:hypothetical protein